MNDWISFVGYTLMFWLWLIAGVLAWRVPIVPWYLRSMLLLVVAIVLPLQRGWFWFSVVLDDAGFASWTFDVLTSPAVTYLNIALMFFPPLAVIWTLRKTRQLMSST